MLNKDGKVFPLENAVFFAGGLFPTGKHTDAGEPICEFGMVHNPGDERPYLTKKMNGLTLAWHHSSLYALHIDGEKAMLIDPRSRPASPLEVELTKAQQEAIRKAIETDYFFC